MKSILMRWNLMRTLRMFLGIAILVQGIVAKDPVTIILGFILGVMAFTNIGCCGTNGCAVNTHSNLKTKGVINEELDSKK